MVGGNMKMKKQYKCLCGYSTTNKGAWITHRKSECPIRRVLDRHKEETVSVPELGTRKSACCDAPMRKDNLLQVMVCSKCGSAPGELLLEGHNKFLKIRR